MKAMLSLNVIHVFYFEILPIHLRVLAMDVLGLKQSGRKYLQYSCMTHRSKVFADLAASESHVADRN